MKSIKTIIQDIVNNGHWLICTDEGPVTGGPGAASPYIVQEMIDVGEFDDAALVPFDRELLLKSKPDDFPIDIDGTDWLQVAFNFGDNGYRQITWIWPEPVEQTESKRISALKTAARRAVDGKYPYLSTYQCTGENILERLNHCKKYKIVLDRSDQALKYIG